MPDFISLKTFSEDILDLDFLRNKLEPGQLVAYYSENHPSEFSRGLSVGRVNGFGKSTVRIDEFCNNTVVTKKKYRSLKPGNLIILPKTLTDKTSELELSIRVENAEQISDTDFLSQPLEAGDIVAYYRAGTTYIDGSSMKLAMVRGFNKKSVDLYRFKAKANKPRFGDQKVDSSELKMSKRLVFKVMSGEDFKDIPAAWAEKFLYQD